MARYTRAADEEVGSVAVRGRRDSLGADIAFALDSSEDEKEGLLTSDEKPAESTVVEEPAAEPRKRRRRRTKGLRSGSIFARIARLRPLVLAGSGLALLLVIGLLVSLLRAKTRERDPVHCPDGIYRPGSAAAACGGDWASVGSSWAEDAQADSSPFATISNGTHPWRRTVILVSLDGVRADYLNRRLTPNLLDISEQGLRAEHMESVMPSLTFPNHWSIMTGLWPQHHGIIANDVRRRTMQLGLRAQFTDPLTGAEFVYTEAAKSWAPTWWGGEPIWSTVTKSGLKSAVMMWPGPCVGQCADRADLAGPR